MAKFKIRTSFKFSHIKEFNPCNRGLVKVDSPKPERQSEPTVKKRKKGLGKNTRPSFGKTAFEWYIYLFEN